jgi:hypothetical protein
MKKELQCGTVGKNPNLGTPFLGWKVDSYSSPYRINLSSLFDRVFHFKFVP